MLADLVGVELLGYIQDDQSTRAGVSLRLPLETDCSTSAQSDFMRLLKQLEEQLTEQLPWMQGLASDVEHLNIGYQLLSAEDEGTKPRLGHLTAALAAVLIRRLGGKNPQLEVRRDNDQLSILFEDHDRLVHGFSLLYSISFLQGSRRSGPVEPRLLELLEIANLFFLNPLSGEEEDFRNGLGAGFSQEALNSFVNFLHPNPQTIKNLTTRILLLEDNRDLAEIIGDMLSSFSFVVCPAYDGLSGLNRLEREHFDLVLSDIQMPRLDGLGLLRMLRNLKLDIPLVLMTGYSSIWQKEQVLDEGATGYLQKPFSMKELMQVVEKALIHSSESPINRVEQN